MLRLLVPIGLDPLPLATACAPLAPTEAALLAPAPPALTEAVLLAPATPAPTEVAPPATLAPTGPALPPAPTDPALPLATLVRGDYTADSKSSSEVEYLCCSLAILSLLKI